MPQKFTLANPHQVGPYLCCDLEVDGRRVYTDALYHDAYMYCVFEMADDDTFQDSRLSDPITGIEVRDAHNQLERSYAEAGYAPFIVPVRKA